MIRRPALPAALLAVLAPALAYASPPSANHPILGTWRVTNPQNACVEILEFRADGTSRDKSGDEQSSSEFDVSSQPNYQGDYVLLDTITETNGQPDCQGNAMPVGDRSKLYLHPTSAGGFTMCLEPGQESCVGVLTPIRKKDSPSIVDATQSRATLVLSSVRGLDNPRR